MSDVPPPKVGEEGFPGRKGPPGRGDPGLVEITMTMVGVIV